MDELNIKLDLFQKTLIKQLSDNSYKGNILDFKEYEKIITEIEYHKAKALIAIRVGNKQAAKEYIADTVNFLFALGNSGGLYDNNFEDNNNSFEINKNVEVFVPVTNPSLNNNKTFN